MERLWTKPTGDAVNVIAAVIGIFGFISGIPSIPVWIALSSGTDQPTISVVWFSPAIPVAIAVPVFLLSLLFVFGLYFSLLIRVFRQLFLLRIVTAPETRTYSYSNRDRSPADTFATVFFVCIGAVLAFLLAYLFFGDALIFLLELAGPGGSPGLLLMVIVVAVGIIVFLILLCNGARDAGVRQEIAVQPKRRY